MGENHLKTFGLLLKFVLLLQLMYFIRNHQFRAEATQPEEYDRLSKIEAQTQRHEKEISLLKTEKIEDRKEIHQLRERVALLEDSTFSNVRTDDKMSRIRPERPARLLPLQVLFGKKKNESDEDSIPKRFFGPPTSCEELQKLGYTLNGYYHIKGKGKLDANRIQMVYCKFHQPQFANKTSLETWIGNVEVKTKSVHFYVTRNTSLNSESGYRPITFDFEQLNVGGAMNLKAGIFTAPVDGIYHFELKCSKNEVPRESTIFLVVKEKVRAIPYSSFIDGLPAVAATHMPNLSNSLTVSLTASLKLKASDEVKLFSRNGRESVSGRGEYYTQFVGWLVEEAVA